MTWLTDWRVLVQEKSTQKCERVSHFNGSIQTARDKELLPAEKVHHNIGVAF